MHPWEETLSEGSARTTNCCLRESHYRLSSASKRAEKAQPGAMYIRGRGEEKSCECPLHHHPTTKAMPATSPPCSYGTNRTSCHRLRFSSPWMIWMKKTTKTKMKRTMTSRTWKTKTTKTSWMRITTTMMMTRKMRTKTKTTRTEASSR